jgi:hypothetical protein
MAHQESDSEITPLRLERILSKKPEFKYDLSKYTDNHKKDKLNNMCDLMIAYGLPAERCEDLMFFGLATPDYLIPAIELSSKIYDLAEKHNTTFKDIITGIAAKADTVFYFPKEFPNAAYLVHAIHAHGLKEGGTAEEFFEKGLKSVENLVNAERDFSEEFAQIKAGPPEERNTILDNLRPYIKL